MIDKISINLRFYTVNLNVDQRRFGLTSRDSIAHFTGKEKENIDKMVAGIIHAGISRRKVKTHAGITKQRLTLPGGAASACKGRIKYLLFLLFSHSMTFPQNLIHGK